MRNKVVYSVVTLYYSIVIFLPIKFKLETYCARIQEHKFYCDIEVTKYEEI